MPLIIHNQAKGQYSSVGHKLKVTIEDGTGFAKKIKDFEVPYGQKFTIMPYHSQVKFTVKSTVPGLRGFKPVTFATGFAKAPTDAHWYIIESANSYGLDVRQRLDDIRPHAGSVGDA